MTVTEHKRQIQRRIFQLKRNIEETKRRAQQEYEQHCRLQVKQEYEHHCRTQVKKEYELHYRLQVKKEYCREVAQVN